MRYVIVDLEATCWMQRCPPERMEIIEIGAVLIPARPHAAKVEFDSFVRPVKEPRLSAFCMGLTGIRQADVDKASDFSTVFPRFLAWIGSKPFRLCSWGLFDLLQFKTDCRRHGMAFPAEFSSHVNLKLEFARIKGVRPCGVNRALALSELKPEGRHHRAIDDVRNIARLAVNVILPALKVTSPMEV